jgi:nicotinate-nucleotide pyrophosphorylase (carboxylating)
MIDANVKRLIKDAVEEDLGSQDLTTEAIFEKGVTSTAEILAREDLVLAGLEVAKAVFLHVDPGLSFHPLFKEGDKVRKKDRIARIEGEAASILKAERVALNFLQHLSGVAAMASAFVDKVSGLPVKIMDTRKTLPGFRALDKYAVRMGGGENHRMGLYDAVLIKDNHIAVAGGIGPAVTKVRNRFPGIKPIEVEVTDLTEVQEALEVQADVIMLDNMDLDTMSAAVELIHKQARVEASGNIHLGNVRNVALTGVDQISVGALTHSVRAVDISLEMKL